MPDSNRPLIRCAGLHKRFDSGGNRIAGLNVLRGIDFGIGAGELVGIVGASGAGKSTLLHLLGGLDRPTSGTVFWNEQDIATLNDDELARSRPAHAAFVFQFHHLLPEFSAVENVALAAMIAGKKGRDAHESAKEILQKVGLSSRADHLPAELSGGEQQRVAIARALINEPSVVLADEPTGNLDSANAEQVVNLILELNERMQQAFILVTHNAQLAEQAGRLFAIHDGLLELVRVREKK